MNDFRTPLMDVDMKVSRPIEEGKTTLKLSSSQLKRRKKLFGKKSGWKDLLVPINSTVILGDEITPQIVSTSSIDEYKMWIGRSNKLADDYSWEMPSKAWNGKHFESKTELTKEEALDIEKSGWIYLFNDSKKVASYSKVIEQYHGSFDASLYHFRRIIIQPGGRLIVKGKPSILLIDDMEIQGAGQFETYTICHTTIGSLCKTEQNKFINN